MWRRSRYLGGGALSFLFDCVEVGEGKGGWIVER